MDLVLAKDKANISYVAYDILREIEELMQIVPCRSSIVKAVWIITRALRKEFDINIGANHVKLNLKKAILLCLIRGSSEVVVAQNGEFRPTSLPF